MPNMSDHYTDDLKPKATRFRIVPKRDFGSGPGHWIDGKFVKKGFVVTDGLCNIMPGATWFQTIEQAMNGLRILIEVDFEADRFWDQLARGCRRI